jgi:hypothetical protein
MGGKSSFSIYWTLAQQLGKMFWFFFDEDFLGHRAGDNITREVFLRSELMRHRRLFPKRVVEICDRIYYDERLDAIDFQAYFQDLVYALQEINFFVFFEDFEHLFQSDPDMPRFRGGKLNKAVELVDFLVEHGTPAMIPEGFQEFVGFIRDDLAAQETKKFHATFAQSRPD